MSEPTIFIEEPEKPFNVKERIEALERWIQKVENEERVNILQLIERADKLERKILILEQEIAALVEGLERLGPIIGHRKRGRDE